MSRQFGHQRVDLVEVLGLLLLGPLAVPDYKSQIVERSRCSVRAAADAISILRRAGYTEQRRLEDGDHRRKRYQITERGRQLLEHPEAARLLRHARKLFTTCPSPRRRRRSPRDVSPEDEFRRREELLLSLIPHSATSTHRT